MKKIVFNLILIFVCSSSFFSLSINNKKNTMPNGLDVFIKAYPAITFESMYDKEMDDYLITLTVLYSEESKKIELYWSNGSMLPKEEMANKDKYWTLLYNYDYKKPLRNPEEFTDEEIERMRSFGSNNSSRTDYGTPMFFFNEIYDSYTQANLESHLKSVFFLGKAIKVHELLIPSLTKVESEINKIAKDDVEVQKFLDEAKTVDSYFWREIRGTNRKSFHSLGIAIDVMPKNLRGKAIYWAWTKESNPDNWMLTPLESRWMPPQKVIDVFEEEGFIWGGKCSIWDNMHFEYHPELIYQAKTKVK